MKQKKVLFTAHVDSHILAFHTPYLKYLKDKGYEVHVATNGDAEIPYTDVKHVVSFERSPFKPNNLKAIGQLKKIIDAEDYEIIHTHTPMGGVVTRLAARAARKRGTRVIYTAHGFHFFTGAPILNWLIYYPIEKAMARYTDVLIAINKEDYERARKNFKTDVRYVPGVGIDPAKFDAPMTKAEKTQLRKSIRLKDSDFILLYPAELNKNKNQTMLISAMERLVAKRPDIHLLLPGKDGLNGYHQQLVNEKGLTNNIHFLGFRRDIPQLLKIADLAVSASRREGLPVNIMEAMYLGVPVVATNCRGNRDLVEDGKTGFIVQIDDVTGFIDKVERLYVGPETRNAFSERSREAIKPYILDRVMYEMSGIYNS